MVRAWSVAAAAVSFLSLPAADASGLYLKSSPVLQVDAKNYDSLIAKSNHTSIVEFYAPWCGHCQNLKPAFEKAAKSLSGLAKVAAVNCDEDFNKQLCGNMGVQGFPTLKIVRPGKKPGKPMVEDYQGPRNAKAIVEAVKDKIPNHVKRLTDKTLDEWLEGSADAKAILFTEKGTTSATLKALAIDFLSSLSVAQIRNKETDAVARYGISSFPTLILLPPGAKDEDRIIYSGEMTKEAMTVFLSQIAPPNPDPAPKSSKAKSTKSKDSKKASADSSKFSKASVSHESADSASAKATQTTEVLEDNDLPIESPIPNLATDSSQKPIKLPDLAPPLPSLSTPSLLQQSCLTAKSGTCILLLEPEVTLTQLDSPLAVARTALADIHNKHVHRGTRLFPFYTVPFEAAKELRDALGVAEGTLQIVAVNAKKAWVKRYGSADVGSVALEAWVDGLRMGEGRKEDLPLGVVVDAAPEPAEEEKQKEKEKEELEVQFEAISDEEVERLLKGAESAAKAGEGQHDEL